MLKRDQTSHKKHAWRGTHVLFAACRIFLCRLVSINLVWNHLTLPHHMNICSVSVFPHVETALLHYGCSPQKGSRKSRFPSGTNFLMLQPPRVWLPPQETSHEWQTISSLAKSQPSSWLGAVAGSPKTQTVVLTANKLGLIYSQLAPLYLHGPTDPNLHSSRPADTVPGSEKADAAKSLIRASSSHELMYHRLLLPPCGETQVLKMKTFLFGLDLPSALTQRMWTFRRNRRWEAVVCQHTAQTFHHTDLCRQKVEVALNRVQ